MRVWREGQVPKMTLDAAAAAVGTVRQVWFDWEMGRNIPSRTFMPRIFAFTRGDIRPDHFYDLPPIGQLELPIEPPASAPLLDLAAADERRQAADDEPQLQAAA